MTDKQTEIDKNYEVFRAQLPEFIKEHAGKYVLMRHGEPVEFFDSSPDAMKYGYKFYEDGLFSVQAIIDETVDLGWYSHAMCDTHV